jgi:hypothetical protein
VRAKALERACRVVLAPEEAPVNCGLDPGARRAEQRCGRERGGRDRETRTLRDAAHCELQHQDAAEVGERERRRQRTVDQRAVDHDVDVVQAVAQDRRPRGQGERCEAETEHGHSTHVDPRGEVEDQCAHHGNARYRRSQDQPLELLTLEAAGTPQPSPHAEGGEDDGQEGEYETEAQEAVHQAEQARDAEGIGDIIKRLHERARTQRGADHAQGDSDHCEPENDAPPAGRAAAVGKKQQSNGE